MGFNYPHAGEMLALYRHLFKGAKAGYLVRMKRLENPMNLERWRARFMLALNRRMNGAEPPYRKLADQWQIGMRRDRDRLRDIANRVRVYQFETAEARKRFGHLLSIYED